MRGGDQKHDAEAETLRKMEDIEDELKSLGYNEYRERMTDLRSDFGTELIEKAAGFGEAEP